MADIEKRAAIIIQAKNEASAGISEINKSFADVFQSFTGFNLASVGIAGAIVGVGAAIKDSIDETVKWADEMDKLSRITGMSTEEASKMATIFGDFGISTGQLTVAIKKLSKEGIELNIDTLKQMAQEYQALPTAVEKNTFAVKNFGRAGLEMTEILSKTPAQLDALSQSAERSGKVMSGEAVESAQAYKLQLAQLNDQIDGVKISLGTKLIPAVSESVNWIERATQTVEDDWKTWAALGIIVEKSVGTIDAQTASLKAAQLAGVSYTDAVNQVYASELATTDAMERHTTATAELSGVTKELTKTETDAWVSLYQSMDATIATNQAKNEAIQRTKDLADANTILAAGLSGTLGKAQKDYTQTVDDTQSKIDELTGKLRTLEGQQGQNYTVTKDATASQAELTLAQDKVIASSNKLAVAQQKLSENTDPDKQFALQMAVDAATVAVEKSQAGVEKLGNAMGITSTYTIDNTDKIAKLHAELEPLIEKQDAAAEAMKKATAQMIYQTLASKDDAEANLKLAEKLGLIDPASAAAATAAQKLKKEYDSGKLSADEYAGKAKNLADAINALQSKNITITQSTIYYEEHRSSYQSHEQGTGGLPGGTQHGANFIVPPGYPNDSYRMNVQSGEHVRVTPAGGGGSDGGNAELMALIRSLPGEMRRALREA